MRVKKESIIHQLAFNTKKGSFGTGARFESDFDLLFDKNQKRLHFTDIDVSLKGHPFLFSGSFELAGLKRYKFSVSTKQVDYSFAKSLLSQAIGKALSVVNVKKPVDAQATIEGTLEPGEPLVNVTWQTKKNDIESIFFNVANASFTGGYTNEVVKGLPRADPNSRIYINNFSGSWEGMPIQSKKATINDLLHPVITCDLRSKFKLNTLNNLLESQTVNLVEGDGSLDITYHGPMVENSNRNTFINGSLNFNNGRVLYRPRGITMDRCSGSIVFKNSDVFVQSFKSSIKDNNLTMNGSARNILSLIKTNPGKISLDWHVTAPSLNLESFLPLLQKRNTVARRTTAQKGKLRHVAVSIDEMLNQSNIKLDVKTNKLLFKRFVATDVTAAIDMVDEDWHLNDVSLRHANGWMKLTGALKEQDARQYAAAVDVNMRDVDIQKVLYAFNDFQQDALTSQNIVGKLTTRVVVSMNIDRQMAANPSNLKGYIDFSLKNGALIDYEPLQKLQVFVFKKRNFADLRFAELKNRIDIKDREFIINRMEIQSSALTLFVQGVYSLHGNTDISIQIPLSNLKKRAEDYKPENIGADAKAGPSVFVRGQPGEDGNIKFKLDVFNKIRKRLKSEGK
nr:AsmA-like C-terminal region-containing protein [Aridibaculum aurantiacum]